MPFFHHLRSDRLVCTLSVDVYKSTSLWKRTLEHRGPDVDASARDRLRTALDTFRTKAGQLTARIAPTLPELTVHDLTHLDALWEVADVIAGDQYPMTPLEAFVFGGAVLLHDSALCFEAYEGGVDQVRSSTEWKDAFALEITRALQTSQESIEKAADFIALRCLHAKQSELLACKPWGTAPESLHLIDDDSLRWHFGGLIGKIAASHNWSIEEVQSRLPKQVNAPPDLPVAWSIDPVKIACLLRCSDAGHLDYRRAPDFLFALARRSGQSARHWMAQKWLGRIARLESDPSGETVVITSTRPFDMEDAEAWWLAYDSLCLFRRELESANRALAGPDGSKGAEFLARKVAGTDSPEHMAEYLRTEGWQPATAPLHVGNVQRLVESLGGEQLYGAGTDLLRIALRELLQNARDAVVARQAIERDHPGAITVKLIYSASDPSQIQQIEMRDNGVGMSQRVLKELLLDFGASFWASDIVKSEFPGLASSGFEPAGRFGIGFYSVFTVADRVCVTSRRYDHGASDAHQLSFPNGLSLRPVLRTGPFPEQSTGISTSVLLHLRTPVSETVSIKRTYAGEPPLEIDFSDYLAGLAVGLESPVYLERGGTRSNVHENIEDAIKHPDVWLRKLCCAQRQCNGNLDTYIAANAKRLRPLRKNGRCVGFAAITTRNDGKSEFLSMRTVGGLGGLGHSGSDDPFMGFLDYLPNSARREAGEKSAPAEELSRWGREQLGILKTLSLTPIEQYFASKSLVEFGLDPIDLFVVPISMGPGAALVSVDEMAKLLLQQQFVMFRSQMHKFADQYHQVFAFRDMIIVKPIGGGRFSSADFSDGEPKDRLSLAGCIHRGLVLRGLRPRWKIEEGAARSILGVMDALILSTE